MKKQIGLFTAILFAVSTLMVGCKAEVHTHTFAEEWSSDETNHWHAATCECSDVELQKTEHIFGKWEVIKEATEDAKGSKEKSCSVCEYKVTEEIAKLEHTHKFASEWKSDETSHWHAATCGCSDVELQKTEHTFGEWKVTKDATEDAKGSKERVCDVCKYKETAEIAQLQHKHVAGESWKTDDKNHWKECTGCKEKIDVKGHSFGIWETTKEPTETEVCQMQRVCEVCGEKEIKELEGFRFVKGVTITGTESWTPSSSVFVNGRILTIPNLIVSDHEVTRGEYKAVMESDPSTASAYDKDGNELEGDAVLNNPVNNVNWYDAIVYCNKLSLKENLTPCYSIDGSTNPDDWGAVPTESDDPLRDKWDAATCNFEADGYRLPTEAEWEWLARGGENYEYAGSDNVDDVAWRKSNTNDTGTREVKTKAPNGYGLYDMSGNVWEWCWDRNGSISSSTAADGASSGSYRVCRGGSWRSIANVASVSYRSSDGPNYRGRSLGFRVVRQAN